MNFEHSNFDIVSDFGFRYSDLGRDLCISEPGHIAKIGDRTFETAHFSGGTPFETRPEKWAQVQRRATIDNPLSNKLANDGAKTESMS